MAVRMMDENFIRNRITELRLQKNKSEYQLSYALGHSRGYIYNISSGKALPSMSEFLSICDYFGITPAEFFDERTEISPDIEKAVNLVKKLSNDDLRLLLEIMERLLKSSD